MQLITQTSRGGVGPLNVAAALVTMFLLATPLFGQEEPPLDWPREITLPAGTIVIYQPQPESFEGNQLKSRAAISIKPNDAIEPIFGVIWTTARVETDRDARTVSVVELVIDRIRFPESTEAQERNLSEILEREIPLWNLTISLDRLLATMETVERDRLAAEDISSTPPAVIFRDTPTVLVSIDGDPILQAAGDGGLSRVVNTPFTIIHVPSPERYYLHAQGRSWYTSQTLEGSWRLTTSVPDIISALAPEEPADATTTADEPDVSGGVGGGAPPAILIATEPTELIVTDGAAEYIPLEGTDLLYLSNSESDILLEVESQLRYIVLSGRWYSSGSLEGPWAHVPPDDLPAGFANIPAESEMGHLLVSVPGTEAATEAVMDHQIPQTAAIRRSEATLQVEYDGEPQFEDIDDTDMQYAKNTQSSVLKVGDTYYAVDDAVWFTAPSPSGPWVVADDVPQEVYSMPATSPVYNVKYVYVYDSTPDVVYVGYYPGYMHSYVYGGTVVYGTGYYYTPWYGTYYYPYPVTWGYHVRYNPWYGWGYGFSYNTGPFTFSIGYVGYGGWWGPVGYRHYAYGYHRGWHAGYRAGARVGYRAGFRAGTRYGNTNPNLYRRPGNNQGRLADRPRTQAATRAPNVTSAQRNNVFADRNGNVQRRSPSGDWQSRSGSGWQPRTGTSQAARDQMNRAQQQRARGATRSGNYQRSRSRGGRRGGR